MQIVNGYTNLLIFGELRTFQPLIAVNFQAVIFLVFFDAVAPALATSLADNPAQL